MKYISSFILLIIALGLRPILQNVYIDTFIVYIVCYSLLVMERDISIIASIIMVTSLLFSPFAGLSGIIASLYFLITEIFKRQIERVGPIISILLLSFLASIILYLEDILLSLRFAQMINISHILLFHSIISVIIGYIIVTVYNRYNDQQSKGSKIR